ncbi:hypothetical protein niasHT_001775 [Heterodera trifolii]|uniref:Transmembrane protein n=1 Tax=Heterodera trifolii TaxID=157864 RepID=A0ABD2M8V7_9BILA
MPTKSKGSDRNAHNQQLFDENAPEYFPSACCEFLHVQSALYLASLIQLVFVLLLSLLYLLLEQSQFINAVDVFRPGVAFVICINLIGILCALAGVCFQREHYISAQISILIGLVLLSDFLALLIIFAMAFGSRVQFASHFTFQQFVHSFLIDDRRWEAFLGPFWPYLLAILFHMAACAMICFMTIYRRYCQYLRHKYAVVDCSSASHPSSVPSLRPPLPPVSSSAHFTSASSPLPLH